METENSPGEGVKYQDLSKEVEGLLQVFKSDDLERSGKAAEALAEMGEKALPSVIDALGDTDANARYYAVYTLEMMGDARSIAGLIQRLEKDEDWHVRQAAAIALGKMEAEEAIPALVRASEEGEEKGDA